jgi:integrase/recombinase XerD
VGSNFSSKYDQDLFLRFQELAERAGLRQRVTPHTFRHSAATWMLRSGMNPLLVAQVLGHTSLDMIQNVYSHLTPTDAHPELMAALQADRDGPSR